MIADFKFNRYMISIIYFSITISFFYQVVSFSSIPIHAKSNRQFKFKLRYLDVFRKNTDNKAKESPTEQTDASQFVKLGDEERLQKLIARSGISSRRGAESLILDGRVSVNGKIITELGVKVQSKKDMILVDGKKLVLPDAKSTFWVVVHKPKSVISTMEDDKDRDTILSLIPKAKELRLVPVGRLERDSTGLVILTNEVGWIHPLTHPSFQHIKRYEVVVKGIPKEENLESLQKGIILSGETSPCSVEKIKIVDIDNKALLSLIDIVLEESRPMQIQRMMDNINCPVISMKRTEFGPIKLKGLRRGQWRELTKDEIEKLKSSCKKSNIIINKEEKNSKRIKRPGAGYAARLAVIQSNNENNQKDSDNNNNKRPYRNDNNNSYNNKRSYNNNDNKKMTMKNDDNRRSYSDNKTSNNNKNNNDNNNNNNNRAQYSNNNIKSIEENSISPIKKPTSFISKVLFKKKRISE